MSIKSRVKKLEKRTIPAEPSGRCIEKAKMFISSWTRRGIDTPWNDGSEESILSLARQMEQVPGPDYAERLQRVLKRSQKHTGTET
jgi:hypothetical protein